MDERELRIAGNEINGYVVQEVLGGLWQDITRRFRTYDDAVRAFDRIQET